PGTPRTTPTPASATTDRTIQNLLPDDLRRGGRCTSGSSRVAWGGGDVPVEGLCREKFMEGLPLVIRQDTEVTIEGQSRELILLPAHHHRVLQRQELVLEIDQVGRLGRRQAG